MPMPPKCYNARIFKDGNELLEYFFDYIQDCIDTNEIPNLSGFRWQKGLSRHTYNNYVKMEDYFTAIAVIQDVLEDKTLQDKTIDSGTKRLILQTKFGYIDATKQTIDANVKTNTDTASILEQLKQKYCTSST